MPVKFIYNKDSPCSMSKSVTFSEQAYRELCVAKGKDESFSELFLRLIKLSKSL